MESYSVFLPSYSVGPDVYDLVPSVCEPYGKTVVVVGGKTAMMKTKSLLTAALAGSKLELLDFVWYGGDSSYENADAVMANPAVKKADMIFAVGGGRAVDTCKVAADKMGKPLFTFPTIASNCAACTAVCVIYDKNGVMKELYFPKKSATHTFINTRVIAQAPRSFLWAGIGDALSKQYECTFSARGDELDHTNALGVQISRMCTEPLLRYGAQALADCDADTASYALEQVALDIIISTGLVSVLVINDYNSCLAHAVYYGCTVLEEVEKNHLHGEIVAYGVLVQLCADGQLDEMARVYDFNKSLALPTCLADLDVEVGPALDRVLDKAASVNDVKHAPLSLTRDVIEKAVLDVESYHATRV